MVKDDRRHWETDMRIEIPEFHGSLQSEALFVDTDDCKEDEIELSDSPLYDEETINKVFAEGEVRDVFGG